MKTNEKSATNTQQQQASWRPISFIMLAQHVTKTQRRESHRCSVHKSRVTAARAQEVFFLFILYSLCWLLLLFWDISDEMEIIKYATTFQLIELCEPS